MADVILICVGKLKEKFYIDAFDEYAKRIGGFCKFSCIELQENRLSDNPSDREIQLSLKKEAEKITAHLPKDAYVISMCVEGKRQSSEQLAGMMNECYVSGKSKIVFIIGGSFGIAPEIKSASDFKLSMSEMTFPHHLARIMLAEQVYRAFKINAGSRYHK